METKQKVFVEVNDKSIECLEYILDNIGIENIHIYWAVQNIKKDKNGKKAIIEIKKSFEYLVDFEKMQISKIYFLNLIEQQIINNKDTDLNRLVNEIISTLQTNKTLREDIMYSLCLQNIESIFDDPEIEFIIQNNCTENKNTKYVISGLDYATKHNQNIKKNSSCSLIKCKKM